MNHKFRFKKGRGNIEIFSISVKDPAGAVSDILNVDSNIDPSTLTKIELVVGDVVISSPDEITWAGDVITIKPSVDHLALMQKQAHSELVIYRNGPGNGISSGYTFVN
jgi:hypothetical protein